MIHVLTLRASLAYFYEDILLIFMNIKFYEVQIEERKKMTNMVVSTINVPKREGGPQGIENTLKY